MTTSPPATDSFPTTTAVNGDAVARSGAHLAYNPALDGLRALAVMGVLLYHGGNGWLPGGYLGVDLFFTLSGFLITTLLVLEWRAHGTISLKAFYIRRARRLLPALFLCLGLVGIYAVFDAQQLQMERLRADVIAAVLYVSNWRAIFAGQSYFEQFLAPSPLSHLWSLAIEEQWYFFWPLAMIGLLHVTRGRLARLGVIIGALAVASAVWMAWLAHSGASLNRMYLGTDTRAQSLLIGAGLAVLTLAFGSPTRRLTRIALQGVAGLAAFGLLVAWFQLNDRTTLTYRFGFFSHAIAVAVIIAATCIPGPARTALAVAPLRGLGKISYGLYLYHWPIYLMLTAERTGLTGAALFAVRITVSVGVAVLSYFLVEMPVRRGALHGWVRITGAVAVAGMVVAALIAVTVVRAPGPARAVGDVAPAPLGGQLERPTATDLAPLRVMITGDSLAGSLAQAYPQLQREGVMDGINGGRVGCGFAEVGEERYLAGLTADPRSCRAVPGMLPEQIQRDHPQVVGLFGGVWEMSDRRIDGVWHRYPDAMLDDAIVAGWTRTVNAVRENGAVPVILTTPYFDRRTLDGSRTADTNPARVDHLNALLRSAAAQTNTPVIDTNAFLSANGDYAASIDGRPIRNWDRTHFAPEGAYYADIYIRNRLVELVRQGAIALPTR